MFNPPPPPPPPPGEVVWVSAEPITLAVEAWRRALSGTASVSRPGSWREVAHENGALVLIAESLYGKFLIQINNNGCLL